MRTAQILLGLIIAPAKKDLLGMDTHAQVKKKTYNNWEAEGGIGKYLQNRTMISSIPFLVSSTENVLHKYILPLT